MPRRVTPSTTTQTTMTPLTGFAIVLGAATLFGTLGPASRFAYDAGMEPAAFVVWRALIGVAGTLVFIAWRLRRGFPSLVRVGSLSPRVRLTLLVAALMGFTLNLCMFFAFERITVALALLGFYTYPAIVAVVNVVLGREPLDTPRLVALGLALLGMVAVVASQIDPIVGIRFDAIGLGLAIAAALSQAVFVVISRDGYREVSTEQSMATVLIVTVVGATLVALASGHASSLALPLRQPSVVPLLLFTGILGAAIPSLAFLTGIRAIGGTRAGILMLWEPVVGVLLAAWLLGESLVPVQLAGALAILAAAVILQRASSPSVEVRAATVVGATVPPDDGRALRVPGGP